MTHVDGTGRSFVVAPITHTLNATATDIGSATTTKRMWLPPSETAWVDWTTLETLGVGPKHVLMEGLGLGSIPVAVRGGDVIPLKTMNSSYTACVLYFMPSQASCLPAENTNCSMPEEFQRPRRSSLATEATTLLPSHNGVLCRRVKSCTTRLCCHLAISVAGKYCSLHSNTQDNTPLTPI
jgi:hypothetical protein